MSAFNAAAATFAHLAGGRRARAADDSDNPAETDDDKARKAKADAPDNGDDGDTDPKDDDKAKADAPDNGDDGDTDPKDDNKAKKAKKAKAATDDETCDDEDDDKKEMSGSSPAAAARRRERARCAAIFAHPHAAHNTALAASLAFETTMSRSEALAVLKSQPAQASSPQGPNRAGQNPRLGPAGDGAGQAQPVAAGWATAFAKVNPRDARAAR